MPSKITDLNFRLLFTCLSCMMALSSQAQEKTRSIGNKLRTGSTNNSFNIIKGGQVGIRMNAGHKPVELLKLNFHVDNQGKDTIPFKVNVYTMDNKLPTDNLVKEEIKGTVIRSNQPENQLISVDLSAYKIEAKGDILVSVEFLNTQPGKYIGFSCGLLNGGTYHKNDATAEWKKMSVVGADFNVQVKRLKQN